jgi:phosphotransferase system IIB component
MTFLTNASDKTLLFWLIIIPMILIFGLMIVALVIRIIKVSKLNRGANIIPEDSEKRKLIYDAYGGIDNIRAIKQEVSRVIVEVKDYELVNGEAIKGFGATGVLLTGNIIKASFGDQAESIYNLIKL